MGPALVAVLITHLGRTAAFNYSAAGWIPCGLLLLGAGALPLLCHSVGQMELLWWRVCGELYLRECF